VRNQSGIRAEEKTGLAGADKLLRKSKPRNAAQNKDRSNAGADNERTGRIEPDPRTGNEKTSNKNAGHTKLVAIKTKDPQRAVIDPRLAQTGTQDPIRVKVDLPRGTAGTGKRNWRY